MIGFFAKQLFCADGLREQETLFPESPQFKFGPKKIVGVNFEHIFQRVPISFTASAAKATCKLIHPGFIGGATSNAICRSITKQTLAAVIKNAPLVGTL